MTFADTLYSYLKKKSERNFYYGNFKASTWSMSDVKKLESIARKYGFPPEWLANLIYFETGGTFNPSIKNSIGATGLIQFIPSTARDLGTTTSKLAKMSVSQQLDYVDKYIRNFFYNFGSISNKVFDKTTGKVKKNFTETDLFMIIFTPASVGNPNYIFNSATQKANNGIKKPSDYTKRALSNKNIPFYNFPQTLTPTLEIPKIDDEEGDRPFFYKVFIFIGLSIIGYQIYQNYKGKLGKFQIKTNTI
jgi:hypothetical protein